MDSLEWKAHWDEIRGRVKNAYPGVADEDLWFTEGHEDQLIGRIQQKTGKSRRDINSWLNSLSNKI